MPNRVDTNVQGTRPAAARTEARPAPAAPRAAEAPRPEAATADRVEISPQARNAQRPAQPRNEELREQPEAGEQGAVNRATSERAARLREEQETRRQRPADGAQRPGDLVDVTGD